MRPRVAPSGFRDPAHEPRRGRKHVYHASSICGQLMDSTDVLRSGWRMVELMCPNMVTVSLVSA